MLTKDRLKTIVQEVGFHACGITQTKVIPQAESALREWTHQGKHGEMKYLERYEQRKNDFWSRFPDAKSIIVLGVNYYGCHPEPFGCHSERSEESASLEGKLREGSKNEDSSPDQPSGTGRPSGHPPLGQPAAFGLRMTGKVARYAWGRDYHKLIGEKIELLKEKLGQEISEEIYFESAVDTKPLLERTLAQQAGLGFIGKQTQLLSLQFGPWLFLSELITNLELEPDQPFQGSCGTCRLCIDECPTEAIEENGNIDARKCIAYLTIEHKSEIPEEFRAKIGDWVFGCDECLNVCPYTAKQKETGWKELSRKNGFGPELNLLDLFNLKSNRQYERRFEDSAISRAHRKQLLRNAAVVLGNKGNRATLPLLKEASSEVPLMVKSHLDWAIKEIERRSPD